jgi:starch phosphorylase
MSQEDRSLHERLRALAQNLWWSWHPEVISLFTDLDPQLWRSGDHNPIAFLNQISPEKVEQRASELVLHSRINYAFRRLNDYLNSEYHWGSVRCPALYCRPVAYFSAEFGLHESMPIYSGGLGVLAGDHLKSASDLGVPLIGIGLMYRQGYFSQHLNKEGWQEEEYINLDPKQLPLEPVLNDQGQPLTVSVDLRHGSILVRPWSVKVGRIKLYLLDSNVEGNSAEDRDLTSRLYGGDNRIRIRQELVLGIGGRRVLDALKIYPGVLHLNEGHSSFAILEEIRRVMEYDSLPFHRARRRVSLYTVFTTHTPVTAGHDRFSPDLVEEHLGAFREKLGLSHEDFMAQGRVHPQNNTETFCMTVLALKNCRYANAVSAIHQDISKRMWHCLWPERPENEVPIGHITNGIHVLSWLAPQMHQLFDAHLGQNWPTRMGHPEVWKEIENIDDGELWETHQNLKMRLIRFVRRRVALQTARRGETQSDLQQLLDPSVLTIGFARRFATYKRADMILCQPDRLAKLVNDPNQPIQLVFAGKSHPRDDEGKRVLQRIVEYSRDPEFKGRLVFVEDYDYNVTRHMVQGVDVWLNNPRRPLEACGTSGEKAVPNGGLNLSVLDGWWSEGYDGRNGFAIGRGSIHNDPSVQYQRDAEDLYRVLEEEVIPLYYQYERRGNGVPHQWVKRMKWAMQGLGWRFNADRMVKNYVENLYMPSASAVSVIIP